MTNVRPTDDACPDADMDVWSHYRLTRVSPAPAPAPTQSDGGDDTVTMPVSSPRSWRATRLAVGLAAVLAVAFGAWIAASVGGDGDTDRVAPTDQAACSQGLTAEVALGAQGPDALCVESRLATLGYDPGPIDGDFDDLTDGAVRAFQRDHGRTVDGIVGPRTAASMSISFHTPAP